MAEIGHATFKAKRAYDRIGLHLQVGDTVDLPVELATWIERDQADTLEHVDAIPTRAVVEPPVDRMVRQAEMRSPVDAAPGPEEAAPIPHQVVEGATKSGRKR